MADGPRSPASWRPARATTAGRGSAPVRRPVSRRRYGVLLGMLTVVGTIAGIVYFFWAPKVRPDYLGLVVAQSAGQQAPLNPWAEQDATALAEFFASDKAHAEDLVRQATTDTGPALLDELRALAERGNAGGPDEKRPAVVFLSTPALVSGGQVYLLTRTASPQDRGSWLPLSQVLDELRPRKRLLLLLDIMRPDVDPRRGTIDTEVSTAVKAELDRLNEQNPLPYLVLCACDAGQVSRTSPELRRSVFAQFVELGLKGEADQWGGPDVASDDGWVSARELAAYVSHQVAWWAIDHRGPPQTPFLSGGAKGFDFALAQRPRFGRPSVSELEPADPYPKWLQDGWKLRDDWRDKRAAIEVPQTLRLLEAHLLRAERRWLAGQLTDSLTAEFAANSQELVRQREKLLQALTPPAGRTPPSFRSLAELARVQPQLPEMAEALRNRVLAPLRARPPGPSPKEMSAQEDAALAKVKGALAAEKPAPPAFPVFAAAVFEEALHYNAEDGHAHLRRLVLLLEEVSRTTAPPPTWPAELLFLRYLASLDADRVRLHWLPVDPNILWELLDKERVAEQAAAMDARAWPFVRAELAAADEQRRAALIELWTTTGGPPARKVALDRLKQTKPMYERVRDAATMLERASDRLTKGLSLLAAVALSPSQSDAERLGAAIQALSNGLRLSDPAAPPRGTALEDLTRLVRSRDGTLEAEMNQARAPYSRTDLDALQTLSPAGLRSQLASPLWSGEARTQLAQRAADLALAQANATLQAALNQRRQPEIALPANSVPQPDWSAQRVRTELDLLDTIGVPHPADWGAKPPPAGDPGWPDRLRKVCGQDVSERYRRAVAVGQLAEQARLAWGLHPFALDALVRTGGTGGREPIVALQRQFHREYYQQLGDERYRGDAKAFRALPDNVGAAYASALEDLAARAP